MVLEPEQDCVNFKDASPLQDRKVEPIVVEQCMACLNTVPALQTEIAQLK